MNNLVIRKVQEFSDKYLDKYLDIAIAYIILLTWLWANLTALQWLFDSILQTSWFNKILIISVILALTGWTLIKSNNKFQYSLILPNPHSIKIQPLLLIGITSILAIALQWTIELPQVNAVLFLLGSYGLCGLFLEYAVWRKGLAIAFTISIVLPFSLQFTSGLGFAARVLTSHAVEQILAFGKIAAISSHDIIVLENGIAHVDSPCSGLRSLWTGTLFLLGATWLEGRKLGFRWLLIYAGCLVLVVLANIGRVLLLTIITFVLKQPLIAELIHVPLGIAGFIGACGLTWIGLIRFVPKFIIPDPKPNVSPQLNLQLPLVSSQVRNQSRLSLISLFVGITIFAIFPRPHLIVENILWIPQMPAEIQTQPLILSPKESEFFGNNAIATKQRFQFGDLTGAMLLVSSNSWRTHHAPELCFTGNGLRVDSMTSLQLDSTPSSNQSKGKFPIRWLTLEEGKMSAMYWFQSPHQTTDELLTRIWSEVSYSDRAWMMVSVLFDRTQSADNPEVREFANSIRGSLFPTKTILPLYSDRT